MNSRIKTAILILLAAGFLAISIIEARGNGDFKVFLEAAKLLRDHESPYNKWIFVSQGVYAFYYYSPLFAVLLIPFSYLPQFIPNFIWLLLNIYFLYRTWQLITSWLDIKEFDARSTHLLFFLIFLFTIRFIHDNFGRIQMTIYLLWSILESVHSFRNRHPVKGSAILALAINIKIMPVVLIPYLLYRNHIRPVLYTMGFLLVFLLIPSFFAGYGFNNLLLSEWWSVVNPWNKEHLIEAEWGIHSLTALIPALLHKTSGELDLRRHLIHLDLQYVEIILHTARLLLILFTLYFLSTLPFKPARSKLYEFWELSYIILLIPLIFPHQQKYAFVLMLPAIAYIFYFLIYLHRFNHEEYDRSRWKRIVVCMFLFWVLTTLTTSGIIGWSLTKVTQHYKTITCGAILLLIVLARCHPRYTGNIQTAGILEEGRFSKKG